MKKINIFLITILLFSGFCNAEPAKKESVEKLLVLMDSEKMLDSVYAQTDVMLSQMLANVKIDLNNVPKVNKFKAQYSALVKEEMSWDKLKSQLITVYMEVYTEEDIKAMNAFYGSPVGKKVIAKNPQLMQASMKIMQTSAAALMPKIQALQEAFSKDISTK